MKRNWIICIFLALFICIVLFIGSFSPMNYFEGFFGGINDNSVRIPDDGIIPKGFYKDAADKTRMKEVPPGYYATDDKSSIIPINGNNGGSIEPVNIPADGIIPEGYYISGYKIDAAGSTTGEPSKMSPVPYGFYADPATHTLRSLSQTNQYAEQANQNTANRGFGGGFAGSGNKVVADHAYDAKTKYNANTFNNVQYHDTLADINAQTDIYDLSFGSMTVVGPSGNLITIPYTPVQGNATYYQPGSYPFGAASYVPNYEDSVFLSRLTKMSTTSPVYNSASELGGFCSQKKSFPYDLEQKCNSLNKNTCGSTSCCVLLGGSKCVSGDANGPTMKSNYSDIFVKNREQYYHQGKCYGNCQD